MIKIRNARTKNKGIQRFINGRKKQRERHETSREQSSIKTPCSICGISVTKRGMKTHQQSVKCQSHVPEAERVDNTVSCDRCGKTVPKTYMCRHKHTIDCM